MLRRWRHAREAWADPEAQAYRRSLIRWLLIGPVVLVILLGCGQLALLGTARASTPSIRSALQADYRPWDYTLFHRVDPAIIDEIRHDEGWREGEGSPLVVWGQIWPAPAGGAVAAATSTPMAPPEAATAAAIAAGTVATAAPAPTTLAPTTPGATDTPGPSVALALTATATPGGTASRTPTSTLTRTPSVTATRTLTRTSTATATRTATRTSTASPTRTATPSPSATRTPVPTATSTATRSQTPSATPTATPTNTSAPTLTPTPSSTVTLTATPSQTPTPTSSLTPTATYSATPTDTQTPTLTPSPSATPTQTDTPSPTSTPTITLTPTDTETPTDTPTATQTPTSTATPTQTPIPCSGSLPPGEPDIIPPAPGLDGWYATIACGTSITLDLGAAALNTPHGGYDLVYYERELPAGSISLDWVIVDVCADAACTTAYTVFNWGDGSADLNTNIGALYGAPEADNQVIPLSDLWGMLPNKTGIAIDIDAVAPPGVYQWVRLSAPLGGANDPADVDAVEVLP